MLVISNYIKSIIYVASITLALISIPTSAAEKPADATIYYTELTCKPEKNIFEMHPKSISKTELAGKKDAQSAVLKTKDYAVFLNGKLVGEKVFKQDCMLKNEVKVEVDVDYGRKEGTVERNKEVFEVFRKSNNNTFFSSIYRFKGEVNLRKNDNLLASISNPLIKDHPKREGIVFIYVTKDKLKLLYPDLKDINKRNQEFLLKELQSKPLSRKSFTVTIVN